MNRLKLFIPLILFLGLGALLFKGLALDPNKMPSALVDKSMPEFSLPALADPDKILSRKDIVGQVSLLNVWATWCPSCVAEHPYLLNIADQEKIPIYGLNYKDDRAQALKWLARLGNPYVTNVFDESGSLGLDLGVFGAPETYVLDQKGVIRYKHVGVVDDRVWDGQIKPIIQKLLDEAEKGRG
jgi:cytochrome c biogenesis protein CcmG/thiol:disulfide interchange protein DsbE